MTPPRVLVRLLSGAFLLSLTSGSVFASAPIPLPFEPLTPPTPQAPVALSTISIEPHQIALAQSVSTAPIPQLPNISTNNSNSVPRKQIVPSTSLPPSEPITLRSDLDELAQNPPQKGSLELTATDPDTGKPVNININSDELSYDPQTAIYTVEGNVYIIIPEKETELLADKVTFDTKLSTMVATGNVFIINDGQVLGSQMAHMKLKDNLSFYAEPRTITDDVRVRGKIGLRSDQYTIMRNGRIIITTEAMNKIANSYSGRRLRLGPGAHFAYFTASNGKAILSGRLQQALIEGAGTFYDLADNNLEGSGQAADLQVADKPVSPKDIAIADYEGLNSDFKVKIKNINVYRKKDGFDKIYLHHPYFRYKKVPLFYMPLMDFGYQENQRFLTYLGPDIGFSADYGGFYAGPGWDFPALKGWLKLSPIVTYGSSVRTTDSNQAERIDNQLGFGFLGHYRAPGNQTEFGYSTTVRQPILMMQQRLFGRNGTRLRLGMNHLQTNGFFGPERPKDTAEVIDYRNFNLGDRWSLGTYLSSGVMTDNFFPTRSTRFFVSPKGSGPVTAGRFQVQGRLLNSQPLLYLGNFGSIGALAQARLSAYTTGDVYGILQAGPYLNLLTGPVFSQISYRYGVEAGESPFVFDTFFQGRNNIQTINTIDLGKFVNIGAVHGFNLDEDNARNSLLIDQRLFMTVGSKALRLTVGVDLIQKRSFFGITINPQGGQIATDYSNLNIYEQGYNPRRQPPAPVPTDILNFVGQ